MKTSSLFSFLAAGALALGVAGTARASKDPFAPATAADTAPSLVDSGLIGRSYAGASYGFLNLDGTRADAHALTFDYNRPVDAHLDTFAQVRLYRSDRLPGGRDVAQELGFGARFHTRYGMLKPYWDLGLGWAWAKGPGGFRDNTFTWQTALGVEIPVVTGLSVAPYARYGDAIDFRDGDSWRYGVKGNYWVNPRTAILAGLERADQESWEYRVGVNYRF